MGYPSFPLPGNTPAWLTTFDPHFMGGPFPDSKADAFTAILGGFTGLPLGGGGAEAMINRNSGAFFFAWNGQGAKIQPVWFPQRIGLRYAYLLANGATVGGGT